jgi:mRNA-degrading endonuclease toxin of MazEF toxin-antitoxin module
MSINNLIDNTDISVLDDKKRTQNYLVWLKIKTDLVLKEKDSIIPPEFDKKIQRGAVVWVEFGFNIGREFGGRHPALILKRTGDSVFVIPLSSQRPNTIKPYHVQIPRVYGFKNMERWTNVLKVQNVSIIRIDFLASMGNVKGEVLNQINKALAACNPLK